MRIKDNWLQIVLQNVLVSLCDQVLYELVILISFWSAIFVQFEIMV